MLVLIVDDEWQQVGKKRSLTQMTSSPVNERNYVPLSNRYSPIAGSDEGASDDSFDLPVRRTKKRRKRINHCPINDAATINTDDISEGN